ncbi:MAG: glycerol kinase GlpK [Gammaproteobacteria bacterium]|nr:glycerol kinase GlpK [Gammaproteobacteria bacterium]MDP2140356.1 glycerol kinase GlpK [Gammaproteobacteria bacterium]MDP2346127.1 glycerol kinase GlpK [Gammaproteobacteria bacterium]
MTDYLLAFDQGTTSSRAIVFDYAGQRAGVGQEEFTQHFPHDGWVEHDPEDLWLTSLRSYQTALEDAKLQASDIRAIGITNQRETTLLWNRHTGKAIHRAIVWQDRRTSAYCQQIGEQLEREKRSDIIQAKTGLLLDPYFSATKIRWMLDNVPGAQQAADAGELAFGTVDTFLLWRLTGGRSHFTDATNASRTLLFNIHEQCWDEELLALFDIPRSLLPEVLDSAADFGITDAEVLGAAIPITGMAGDQQAAAFGQCCFEPGMAKSTYGTGCFLLLNTGDKALKSENRLLSTIAYRLNGKATYALEGSIFMAGATMQWLRDGLKLFKDAAETEKLAEQTGSDMNVLFVPAFTGLGAPYWDADARGAIFGLTRDTGIKELVTAALLSVCYQTRDLQKAMEADGVRPATLRVDGGMAKNDFVLQNLADLLGCRVDRPRVTETTALGVAFLAGLQCGVYESMETITSQWQLDKSFSPAKDKAWRDERYALWQDAVNRTRSKLVC